MDSWNKERLHRALPRGPKFRLKRNTEPHAEFAGDRRRHTNRPDHLRAPRPGVLISISSVVIRSAWLPARRAAVINPVDALRYE